MAMTGSTPRYTFQYRGMTVMRYFYEPNSLEIKISDLLVTVNISLDVFSLFECSLQFCWKVFELNSQSNDIPFVLLKKFVYWLE